MLTSGRVDSVRVLPTRNLGTGVMWATEIDWGANLKDGFKFVGSVEGDYIVAISEMLFSSFSGDSGPSPRPRL